MLCSKQSVPLLALVTIFSCSPPVGADSGLAELVGQLDSNDRFSRHRAEAEIRKRGTGSLPEVLGYLRKADAERGRRLGPIFNELLQTLLDDFEVEFGARVRDSLAVERLTRAVAAAEEDRTTETPDEADAAEEDSEKPKNDLNEDLAERLENLKLQIEERVERLEEQHSLLDALFPESLPTITRRSILGIVRPDPYESMLQGVLQTLDAGRITLDHKDANERKHTTLRYQLAPFWHWVLEQVPVWEATLEAAKAGASKKQQKDLAAKISLTAKAKNLIAKAQKLAPRLKKLLQVHMERGLADLLSGDFRTRERAEDSFFLLGRRGVSFLEKTSGKDRKNEYLLGLLRWRIHPRVRERTGMDFRDYPGLSFRERRRFLIDYTRTAGKDAAPTLRELVDSDELEPLNRVKLTAAEALAGLGDLSAIQELNKRRIPELLKIPEISREFFLLQGLKFQEEKQYELAIEEFQKILDESPFHFQANYHIAFAYLLAKNYKKSIHHFVIARRIRPQDMLTLYNLACAYSLDGQIEHAIEALGASIKAGFVDHNHISKDPDLDPLRDQPAFQKLLNKLGGAGSQDDA